MFILDKGEIKMRMIEVTVGRVMVANGRFSVSVKNEENNESRISSIRATAWRRLPMGHGPLRMMTPRGGHGANRVVIILHDQ